LGGGPLKRNEGPRSFWGGEDAGHWSICRKLFMGGGGGDLKSRGTRGKFVWGDAVSKRGGYGLSRPKKRREGGRKLLFKKAFKRELY